MDDAFSILGLPRRFDLTPAEIASAHRRVVAKLHPDRAANPVEREQFLGGSAAAGAAKERLSSDISRAEELFRLLGAASFLAAPLAPDFLLETLELRESIEDACSSPSPTVREDLRSSIQARIHAATEVLRDELGQVVGSGDAGAVDSALRRAADALVRLRYLDRMRSRLEGSD